MFDWIKDQTQAQYIARPDHAFNDLIWPHPDRSIPRGAKITIRSDEVAVFFREGQFIGKILAGTVLMDTANIPFLGSLLTNLLVEISSSQNYFFARLQKHNSYFKERN